MITAELVNFMATGALVLGAFTVVLVVVSILITKSKK